MTCPTCKGQGHRNPQPGECERCWWYAVPCGEARPACPPCPTCKGAGTVKDEEEKRDASK